MNGSRIQINGGQIAEYYVTDITGNEYNADEVISSYADYRDKLLLAYPVRTTMRLRKPSSEEKYFILSITGHNGINKVDKTVQLR
jgi:hypothetical protein